MPHHFEPDDASAQCCAVSQIYALEVLVQKGRKGFEIAGQQDGKSEIHDWRLDWPELLRSEAVYASQNLCTPLAVSAPLAASAKLLGNADPNHQGSCHRWM